MISWFNTRAAGCLRRIQAASPLFFGVFLAVLLGLGGASGARAELANGKFGKAQVFDVQRNPATPVAGSSFTASSFANPFDDGLGQFTMSAGQYYQFAKTNSSPCKYSVSLYASNGSLVRQVSANGRVYGLGTQGFLFISDATDYGTFVANGTGYNLGGSVTYTPTTGLATCTDTANYVPSTTPTSTAGTIPQAGSTVSLTVGGTTYNVAFITAQSYNTCQASLIATPWWGHSSLASSLAAAVGGTLGFPNLSRYGPLFGFGTYGGGTGVDNASFDSVTQNVAVSNGNGIPASSPFQWAVDPATVQPGCTLAVAPPYIASVSPASGAAAGGTAITIAGNNFTGATSVTIGGSSVTYTVVNDTSITTSTPAHAAGTVDVRVVSSGGTSAISNNDQFTYVAAVSGTCGTAASTATSFMPAANLCGAGTAGVVSRAGSSWGWSCAGSGGGGTASCQAPVGNTATNTGAVTASVGVANGWQLNTGASAGFIPVTGHAASPATPPPAGVTFPQGLFDVDLTTGTAGSMATVVITYPTAIAAGSVYYKFGPTAANATPHWYIYPNAVISGNTVTLTLTDGQDGDTDLTANSHIHDPGGPALPGAGGATGVPSLSEWGLLCLTLLLAMAGVLQARRQRDIRR